MLILLILDCFVIQKAVFKKIIYLNIKKIVFAVKTMVTILLKINISNIYIVMALIS